MTWLSFHGSLHSYFWVGDFISCNVVSGGAVLSTICGCSRKQFTIHLIINHRSNLVTHGWFDQIWEGLCTSVSDTAYCSRSCTAVRFLLLYYGIISQRLESNEPSIKILSNTYFSYTTPHYSEGPLIKLSLIYSVDVIFLPRLRFTKFIGVCLYDEISRVNWSMTKYLISCSVVSIWPVLCLHDMNCSAIETVLGEGA